MADPRRGAPRKGSSQAHLEAPLGEVASTSPLAGQRHRSAPPLAGPCLDVAGPPCRGWPGCHRSTPPLAGPHSHGVPSPRTAAQRLPPSVTKGTSVDPRGEVEGHRGSTPGAELGRGGSPLLLSARGREEEAAAATKSGLGARKRRKGRCVRFVAFAVGEGRLWVSYPFVVPDPNW
jgi:hypothetical protein